MNYNEKFIQFRIMIERVLDGSLPDGQIDQFNELIINDVELREYFCEYVNLTIGIEGQYINLPVSIQIDFDKSNAIFNDLLRLEQDAPAVDVCDEVIEERKTIEKPKSLKLSKFFLIYNKLVSIAAVLMIIFILYAHIFPPKYSVPVGFVADQIGLEWAKSSETLNNDEVLLTNQAPYVIVKGCIKLKYDEGVNVIIEGPASFEIDTSKIFLDYGKLYAIVSETGKGFTVQSTNTKLVDLGTEFGVVVDKEGSSELHVLNGQVQFYAGLKDENIESRKVYQDNALRFNSNDGKVESIPVNRNSFVRVFDSSSNFVWDGRLFDIADVVGGGNGFGTGNANHGIDFKSGEIRQVDSEDYSFRVPEYVLSHHLFIDGVFMPDGGQGPVQVTSTGICYSQFPDTHGDCYAPICNNYAINKGFVANPETEYLLMRGEKLKNQISPRICLHSNAGITFDLSAIKSSFPGVAIRRFTSRFGLIKSSKSTPTDVDLFILVDGKEVYSHVGYLSNEPSLDIGIEINDSDRFLTIACMEGTSNYGDWPIFVDPILELEPQD